MCCFILYSYLRGITMYTRLVVLFVVLASAVAVPSPFTGQRIVGGDLTTIDQYPFQTALLQSWNLVLYQQVCAGTILNARSILTAAHCFVFFTDPNHFRMRVGSTYANSGGIEHNAAQIIIHPTYNPRNLDCDVAIIRTTAIIIHNDLVQPAIFAGPGYILADDEPVWAVGWGRIIHNGPLSEELRHVQVKTINQATCRRRYMELGDEVTNNMLCSGLLDVGGKDQCQGDSGGPLIHNGVVVGVCSWGEECALPRHPGVNARVSRFTSWIQSNA